MIHSTVNLRSLYSLCTARWAWGMVFVSTRTQTCRAAVSRKKPSIVCRWSFAVAETTISRTGLRFSGSATDTWTSPPRMSRSEWIMLQELKHVVELEIMNCEAETGLMRRCINNREKSEIEGGWQISGLHIHKGQTIHYWMERRQEKKNDVRVERSVLEIALAFIFEEKNRNWCKGWSGRKQGEVGWRWNKCE